MSNQDVYINKITAFLPNEPVENDDMEGILGQVGARPSRARKLILRNNKITQRYYAIDRQSGLPNYSGAQLAAEAIRKLEGSDFSLSDISCLSTATTMPDQLIPNHGVMVHGEIGSPSCEVVSTSGVCICGVTALKYAWLSVKSGEHKSAVVSASEISSAIMLAHHFKPELDERIAQLENNPEIAFEKDFLRWMLSDGAGAMLLANQPGKSGASLRIDWIDVFSYANEQPACMYAGAIKNEDGSLSGWRNVAPKEVLEKGYFAVKQDVKQLNAEVLKYTIEKPLSEIARKRKLAPSDIDYFIPHYSSDYFRMRVYASLENIGFVIPQEKWFTNLSTKGNTGSASIYIMLEELFNSGKLKRGEKLLCYVPESGRFSTAFMHLTVV